MHGASKTIKQRSMETANSVTVWILNRKIEKSHLPANIKEFIKMVMETKHSDKPIIHKYAKEKLRAKKITAFKNKAITYKMKLLIEDDPLNQMISLIERTIYLLNKQFIFLKVSNVMKLWK